MPQVSNSSRGPEDAVVAVVVPCYRVRERVVEVLRAIPSWVRHIIVVDDACPDGSGREVETTFTDPRCRVLYHERNQGVGGAVRTGIREALRLGATIIVKLDGDGQMDPARLSQVVRPIAEGRADYAKGNRLHDLQALATMPSARRFGNLALTLLVKVASGYWDISDPTNGYIAIHRRAAAMLPLERIDRGYFFESHMLIHLNVIRAVVAEVPMPAHYAGEPSSLRVGRALFSFPPKLLRGFARRIAWRYFIYNMDAVTVFLLAGALLFFGGVGFGAYRWYLGAFGDTTQTPGTVALGLFPSLIGFQMLLQAMILDIMGRPTVPLQQIVSDDEPA
ncbi:MAG: glycosyltransferase family 2 protein [Verrucomicrobia bacterium]|nr:MAG: glycosyltransferase family 2 protein [Verrucomicrobiota bacterium]